MGGGRLPNCGIGDGRANSPEPEEWGEKEVDIIICGEANCSKGPIESEDE